MSSRSRARGYAYGQEYWYGSEAPALYPDQEDGRSRSGQKRNHANAGAGRHYAAAHQGRRRGALMDRALIAFMAGILIVMSLALVNYISLTASVTASVSEIASLESQLSALKSDNDEQLNEVNSRINLDEIKYRAIADLGMTYADKNQVITYSGDSNDYVRQVRQAGN